ncbi:MAG: hypothetical protein M3N26_00195, partial [Pseudomonadota bacterium]|nr:hypothetical protein [Pseudomonadota bacterium]
MKLTPLVPALPEKGGNPRWGLAASIAVHGLLLLAVLGFAILHLPRDGSPAPSYDLVFQGPSGGAPASDSPQKKALPPAQPADVPPPPDAISGQPAPTPSTIPDPNSTTSPPPATDAAPPPTPQLLPQVAPRPSPAPTPTVAEPAPMSAA